MVMVMITMADDDDDDGDNNIVSNNAPLKRNRIWTFIKPIVAFVFYLYF